MTSKLEKELKLLKQLGGYEFGISREEFEVRAAAYGEALNYFETPEAIKLLNLSLMPILIELIGIEDNIKH